MGKQGKVGKPEAQAGGAMRGAGGAKQAGAAKSSQAARPRSEEGGGIKSGRKAPRKNHRPQKVRA